MARRWTSGSNQYVKVAAGALGGVHGYGTVAVMFKRASTGGTQNLVWTGTNENAGSSSLSLDISSSNVIRYYCNDGGSGSTGPTVTATDRWYIIVARKATGTVAATFSLFDMSTRTWAHSTGANSLADGSGTAVGSFTIGSWTTNFDRFNGDMAIAGVFRQWVPTDAEVEALGLLTVPAWLEAARRATPGAAVWLFDQAATTTLVRDITGGGANENGGVLPSVSAESVPLFSYGASLNLSDPPAGGGTNYFDDVLTTVAAVTTGTDSKGANENVSTSSLGLTTSTDTAQFSESVNTTITTLTSDVDSQSSNESVLTTVTAVTSETDLWAAAESVLTNVTAVTTETDSASWNEVVTTVGVSLTSETDVAEYHESVSTLVTVLTGEEDYKAMYEVPITTVTATTSQSDGLGNTESVTTTIIAITSETDVMAATENVETVVVATTSETDELNGVPEPPVDSRIYFGSFIINKN